MHGLTEIHISYSPEAFRAFATVHFNGSGGPGERFFLIHDDSKAQLVLERVGRTNQVATALWLVLLTVFMQSETRFWTILNSIYARARRRPCVTMFGFSRQGR
jgi:hypothetical protein